MIKKNKIMLLFICILALLTVVPVAATPEIMIEIMEPRDGPPGTKVYMMGSGATPMGPVTAFFDDLMVARVLAYREGDWEISFLVPKVSPGEYVVTVLDNETSSSDSVPFTVTLVQIKIRDMQPAMGAPGTSVSLSGYGASPEGEVAVSFNEIRVANTTATEWGDWRISFNVPRVEPGDYTVSVLDVDTNSSDSASFTVIPPQPPKICIDYVSPQSGPVGTSVYVSGSGATPNGEVRVYFDERNVANTMAKDWDWWSVSFEVPDVEPGDHTITALDVTANTGDIAVFTVTSPPTINVSPSEAPIGSKITISGEGFTPNQGIFVTFEDLLLFSPITTDEKGEFNVTLFVPMVNSGNYTIKVITMYYTTQAVANATFTVTLGVDTLLSESSSEHDNPLSDYNELKSKLEDLTSDLSAARNLSYIFIVTTMIFIATTVYLAIRKPRMKTELKAT